MVLHAHSSRAAAATFFVFVATSITTSAQVTTRVSTTPVNSQANYHSFFGSVSDDGRYVAFQSNASNLVLVDSNFHVPDVFLKDRNTSNTTMLSVDSSNVQGNSGSMAPSLSGDGRYTAFESLSSNLVTNDLNGVWDVFVRDQQTGTTVRASVDSAGNEGNGVSNYAALSSGGRFVAFESEATNLVAGDVNAQRDVFLHDLVSGTTTLVSSSSVGAPGDGASTWASISSDGRYVAFASLATNLVAGDTNNVGDVFLKDTLTGSLTRVSVDSAGLEGNASSQNPSISPDGRFVAFQSTATNLVVGDTNGWDDVFLHDRITGQTTRVSVSASGIQGNSASQLLGNRHVSMDGRFVAFDSVASNLVAGDTNATSDCFVHDRLTGATERVSVTTAGAQANSATQAPSISPDGRFVTFEGSATNLVAGDNNNYWDVFLRDRGVVLATTVCYGDGTGAACPCANVGSTGSGCANSVNAAGGRLAGTGTPSVSADTFLLLGTGMPNGPGLYFQGTTQLSGGNGVVFGDGLRCVGGTVVRLGTKTNVAGESHYPVAGDPSVSVRGLVSPSDVRNYQLWYRDSASFCTATTFNLTNAVSVTWGN